MWRRQELKKRGYVAPVPNRLKKTLENQSPLAWPLRRPRPRSPTEARQPKPVRQLRPVCYSVLAVADLTLRCPPHAVVAFRQLQATSRLPLRNMRRPKPGIARRVSDVPLRRRRRAVGIRPLCLARKCRSLIQRLAQNCRTVGSVSDRNPNHILRRTCRIARPLNPAGGSRRTCSDGGECLLL
jgi:hypothetical protein